jgi:hypothetical protein
MDGGIIQRYLVARRSSGNHGCSAGRSAHGRTDMAGCHCFSLTNNARRRGCRRWRSCRASGLCWERG